MERENHNIEIIAVGRERVYSVGRIHFTRHGDVYLISKIKDAGLHLSRHRDGRCHVRTKGKELSKEFEKRAPISDVDRFEFLQTWAFGLDSLPELYPQYKLKNCNAVVAINMRHFEGAAFNLGVALLTEKGLPQLMNMWKDFENRQVYICANSYPMIGIVFGAIRHSL